MSSDKKTTYMSNGHVLQAPPFSVRAGRFFESLEKFLGLYFVTLFAFYPYAAAEVSRFNIRGGGSSSQSRSDRTDPQRWGGSGSSGPRGGGGGGGGGGSPSYGSGPAGYPGFRGCGGGTCG